MICLQKMKTLFKIAGMKFFVSILSFFLLTLSIESAAQVDSLNQSANIYFMRSTGFNGSAVAFSVFIDDSIVCRLNNKRFSIHEIQPGEHRFTIQFAGKKSKEKAKEETITVNVETGKTYYIQAIFQPGMFVNNIYPQEVTESSAKKILPKLKQDDKCL